MDTSDTISLWLAIGTFLGIIVALGLGIVSIRETRNIQRTQYKEGILNSILDWLTDISNCEARHNPTSVEEYKGAIANAESAQLHWAMITGHIENEYTDLRSRGLFLVNMFSDRDAPLPKGIEELRKVLKVRSELNGKYRSAFLEVPLTLPKIADLVEQLKNKEGALDDKQTEIENIIWGETIRLKSAKSVL